MHRMNMNDIEIYVDLMADSFKDDQGIKAQFEGIDNGFSLLKLYCKCQIEAFFKLDCVTTYGDGEGMTIGYFANEAFMERLAQSLQDSSAYLLENASINDLMKMQQNALIVAEIAQPDWYKKFLDKKEVYVLQVIVVRESLRGTGVFRKLISPVLEKAEQKNVPVVLQTHEPEHIVKYENFGFKLMEKVVSNKINLTCYNLLKD